MTKLGVLLFLICPIVFACGQSQVPKETGPNQNEHLSFDTNRIVILPIDTTNHWIFKDASSIHLTNEDLQTINRLLQDCITTHNNKQDRGGSESIDLKEYKLQYIPFLDPKGDKRVYINSFCATDSGFDYWKQALVQVEDGGSCFFHVTINLTEKKFELLFINGYG